MTDIPHSSQSSGEADDGRPVPPHGSGPARNIYANDPDETAGRAFYRARANKEAAASMVGVRRRVKLASETSAEVLALATGGSNAR